MISSAKSKVCFFYDSSVTLRDRTKLKKFIEGLFRKEKKKLDSLNYIFCSDERLLHINKQYLQHDYYTDIITFELSGKSDPVIGEVYISIDRVKENALLLNEAISRELHRVVFHGALHLCGYRDKNREEKKRMREAEDYFLIKYLE